MQNTIFIPQFTVDFSLSEESVKKLIRQNDSIAVAHGTVAGVNIDKIPMVDSILDNYFTIVCPMKKWVFKAWRVKEIDIDKLSIYNISSYKNYRHNPEDGYLVLIPVFEQDVTQLDWFSRISHGDIETNHRPLFVFPLNKEFNWILFAEDKKHIAFTDRKSIESINKEMYIGKEIIKPEVVWHRYVDIDRQGFTVIQKTIVIDSCDMSHMYGIVVTRDSKNENNFGNAPHIVNFPSGIDKEVKFKHLRNYDNMPTSYWEGYMSDKIVIFPNRDRATYGWYKLRDSSTIGTNRNSKLELVGHYFFRKVIKPTEEGIFMHYIEEGVSEVQGSARYADGTFIPMQEMIKVGWTK